MNDELIKKAIVDVETKNVIAVFNTNLSSHDSYYYSYCSTIDTMTNKKILVNRRSCYLTANKKVTNAFIDASVEIVNDDFLILT